MILAVYTKLGCVWTAESTARRERGVTIESVANVGRAVNGNAWLLWRHWDNRGADQGAGNNEQDIRVELTGRYGRERPGSACWKGGVSGGEGFVFCYQTKYGKYIERLHTSTPTNCKNCRDVRSFVWFNCDSKMKTLWNGSWDLQFPLKYVLTSSHYGSGKDSSKYKY